MSVSKEDTSTKFDKVLLNELSNFKYGMDYDDPRFLQRKHVKSWAKRVKEDIEKYLIDTVERWSETTGHYPIEEEIRHELATEQRQSLWGNQLLTQDKVDDRVYLRRKDIVEHFSVIYEAVPVLGMGEGWDEGFIALTSDERKAKKALTDALKGMYDADNIERMEKKTSAFISVKDLYGEGFGWQAVHDYPESATVLTYWMIDMDT